MEPKYSKSIEFLMENAGPVIRYRLRREFSYIPPEISRYESRFEGLNNGNCLMALIYTMQAMLGFGDDYEDLKNFQQISLKGFRRVKEISSLDDMTRFNANARRKNNYPYIEADEYFPNVYTVAMLAYSQSWRTDENIRMLAEAAVLAAFRIRSRYFCQRIYFDW